MGDYRSGNGRGCYVWGVIGLVMGEGAIPLALDNQRLWYAQPCMCDWVIKGLGMSSRVCVTG